MTVSIPILSSNPNLYKHGPFDVTCWFPNRVSLVPPSELISADFIENSFQLPPHSILFTASVIYQDLPWARHRRSPSDRPPTRSHGASIPNSLPPLRQPLQAQQYKHNDPEHNHHHALQESPRRVLRTRQFNQTNKRPKSSRTVCYIPPGLAVPVPKREASKTTRG